MTPDELAPPCVSRRTFLRTATLAGVSVWAGSAALDAGADPDPPPAMSEAADPIAQWVMVIDLAVCDGCGLCTEACGREHNTGDQEWLPIFETPLPDGTVQFLPRPCMHCENAPCVNVCPVKATYHDPHGNVLIDNMRCIGCRMCMAACPYGARVFNWEDAEPLERQTKKPPSPEYPVRRVGGTVDKCMLCAHRSMQGGLPACLKACPMNAIWFGDLARDLVTNGAEARSFQLLISERNGYRLKEDLGTKPRVWYLPGHGEDFSKVPNL